ncbi:MAG: hypothetical protein J3K34DRAFT_181071 [Monoraphidium minutum]|nr:MAG: hypothetical protein J3K34DRAFT_181071 [Monoraphidium minutum]
MRSRSPFPHPYGQGLGPGGCLTGPKDGSLDVYAGPTQGARPLDPAARLCLSPRPACTRPAHPHPARASGRPLPAAARGRAAGAASAAPPPPPPAPAPSAPHTPLAPRGVASLNPPLGSSRRAIPAQARPLSPHAPLKSPHAARLHLGPATPSVHIPTGPRAGRRRAPRCGGRGRAGRG